MAYKIAVACQKGGVGKTTTSVVLAEILSASGFRTMVIDLDSQGNSTKMLTQQNIYDFSNHTIMEAMKEEDATNYALLTKENLSLIPAEDMLVTFGRYIYTNRVSEPLRILERTIKPIEDNYDFIIMDAPPNLGELVLNAIYYADGVIVPVQVDPFGMDGLDRFLEFVESAREEGHTKAELLGILPTMKNSRLTINAEVIKNIRSRYGDKVFNSEIRIRSRLKEFALEGVQMKTTIDMNALEDYIDATKEVVSRVK